MSLLAIFIVTSEELLNLLSGDDEVDEREWDTLTLKYMSALYDLANMHYAIREAGVLLVDEMDRVLEERSELNLPMGERVKPQGNLLLAANWAWMALPDEIMQKIAINTQSEGEDLEDLFELEVAQNLLGVVNTVGQHEGTSRANSELFRDVVVAAQGEISQIWQFLRGQGDDFFSLNGLVEANHAVIAQYLAYRPGVVLPGEHHPGTEDAPPVIQAVEKAFQLALKTARAQVSTEYDNVGPTESFPPGFCDVEVEGQEVGDKDCF